MTSKLIPVDEFDYVVFGGTGDLARRKLIPSLFHRCVDGQILGNSRIVGVSRAAMSGEDFRQFASDALDRSIVGNNAKTSDQTSGADDEEYQSRKQEFLKRLHYIQVDVLSDAGWPQLAQLLGNEDRLRAYYLAVGPSLFGAIAERLHSNGLIREHSRLVIEKPIGHDLVSARELNQTVGRYFDENQIYRIDHYLGKETVQNLMALRFANALYEPLWNSAHIDHVQITVAESIGVEGRGGYYDKSGAIRDMVQNHLLQLLCLVAMEPPASNDADSVRDEKLKVLRSLEPITASNVEQLTVRGQYGSGAIHGQPVVGYLDEIEGGESSTESFVAIKAEIANWRWAGVPFYLRTGKRLAEQVSEISIQFKPAPHNIFPEGVAQLKANRLVIRLQPDEGVKQWIMIKDPGPGGMRLRHIALDMSFAEEFEARSIDAYERLLLDVIRGNATLFMRRDEVEAAWKWIDPIISGWEENNQKIHKYTAGTWGPTASIALIERNHRTWHEDVDN
ncbi:MAG: glucose-6-phosphate dehydrogenase [Hyphomicrobiales bacterium]|nr:glucose-6-phosphate dehydrogenase [Hyphomicrobiales bacterium]